MFFFFFFGRALQKWRFLEGQFYAFQPIRSLLLLRNFMAMNKLHEKIGFIHIFDFLRVLE